MTWLMGVTYVVLGSFWLYAVKKCGNLLNKESGYIFLGMIVAGMLSVVLWFMGNMVWGGEIGDVLSTVPMLLLLVYVLMIVNKKRRGVRYGQK